MSKCLLLVDYQPSGDWQFAQGFASVNGEAPDVHFCVTNWLRTNLWLKIKRYLLYFLFPLRQLKYNGKYDAIIGYQQFYAINLAFFMRLLGIKKKSRIYVMTFIYKEKKGLAGRIYKRYIKRLINSDYIDRLFVYSTGEAEFYSQLFECDRSKFAFVRLGIDSIPASGIRQGDYCFSAGRSNRDFAFLCDAFRQLPYRLRIATDAEIEGVPDNVEVLRNCNGQEMFDCMSGAFCVIIPLDNQYVSSGQLVTLQAMQLSKPVIVTRSGGITDYVEDGQTGLLIDNTCESLSAALEKLSDPEEYERIAGNAERFVRENCTMFGKGESVACLIAA